MGKHWDSFCNKMNKILGPTLPIETFQKPDYPTPWITDIKDSTVGTFGAGFYDFVEFPIGDHKIIVIACNGFHISLDLPGWFEPGQDDWPQISTKRAACVIPAIQTIINGINKSEGTNYKLEFKGV